jgi:hypothetical protein
MAHFLQHIQAVIVHYTQIAEHYSQQQNFAVIDEGDGHE